MLYQQIGMKYDNEACDFTASCTVAKDVYLVQKSSLFHRKFIENFLCLNAGLTDDLS